MIGFRLLVLTAVCLCSLAPARAETSGRQKIEASQAEFRVCADPDNLPFTNRQGDGFENKIAELVARAANQKLVYFWWPERRGFVSKTLNAWECDVVMGVPTGYELTGTTRPYYCSRYEMLYRAEERVSPARLGEPSARSLRIGVVEHTPPLDTIIRRGLDPVVYFTNYDRVKNPPGQIIADLATGKIDVALVWGPVGGYFARQQPIRLETAAFNDADAPNTRLAFPISFGVRRGDKARVARIEALMGDHAAEIEAILRENGVPLVDDPVQCAPARHASSKPASPVHLAADRATLPDAVAAHVERVAAQTGQPQASESGRINCTGTETLQDIQKLSDGPSSPEHPYTVESGKADAKTYSGWTRFAGFCQACHGSGGSGSAIAPDLTQALKSLNKRQFETIVSCGLKGDQGTGVMPAWGKNPNIEPYLENLWAYLKARSDGALGAGRPEKLSASK